MENLMEIPNISLDSLEEEDNKPVKSTKKVGSFDEKNYLNVRLAEGETSKELTIRLLPMDLKTGNPFVKVHVHNVKVPKELAPNSVKPYKTYICLSKTEDIDHDKYGRKCPFCEINRAAYESSTKETDPVKKKNLQDVSIANLSKEAVIVRCIERGKENEGVKFWKFNLRDDKRDPYHTIINLSKQREAEGKKAGREENILDIFKGYDLIVTINSGDPVPPPTISDAKYSTPLSEDEEQVKAWIFDKKKWQDVFTCKPYDYLSLVSEMRIPWFDKENNKWVDKGEVDGQKKESEKEVKKAEAAIKEKAEESFASKLEDKDDLPF